MPTAGRVRWAKFRAAATMLAAAAIISTLVSLLAGGSVFQRRAVLYLYLPDAGGLESSSAVRVDGVGVGKVGAVALAGPGGLERVVKVTLKVERRELPRIPSDSFAQISVDNLVGDQFVDVTSGASRRPVEDGGEIAYKARPPLLRRLDLGGFERQLRAVDATLTDIELGRSRVGQFVVGETVYADLRRRLRELDRGLRIANDSTTAVGKLIYTDALDRKLLDPLRQLDRKLAQWQAGAGTYGKLLRDETSYEQLRRQAAGWRESLAHWRAAGPLTSDSAYLDWSREVASVVRAVDQFTSSRAFASPQPYQDLAAAMNNLSAALAKLQRNPRKVIRFKLF